MKKVPQSREVAFLGLPKARNDKSNMVDAHGLHLLRFLQQSQQKRINNRHIYCILYFIYHTDVHRYETQ